MNKNRWIYIIFTAVSIIFVSCYGGTIPYILFYSMLLIPAAAIVYILFVYLSLRFYQAVPVKQVVKGERLPYEVRLINAGFLSFFYVKLYFYDEWCEVSKGSGMKEQSLMPGEEKTLKSTMVCLYRGEYEVGACEIETADCFGLFKFKWKVGWSLKLVVLPRILSLNSLDFLTELVDAKCASGYEDPMSDRRENELRNYHSGDQVKNIHFKASARTGKLLTRKNEAEEKGHNYLLLDLCEVQEEGVSRLKIEDKMIETALAVGGYFKKQHLAGEIYYSQGGQLKEVNLQEEAAFGRFYEACASLSFSERGICCSLDEMVSYGHLKGSYVLMVSQVDEALLALLTGRAAEENEWILIYIYDKKELMPQMEKVLLASNVRLYKLQCDEEIEKVIGEGESER